MIYARYVGSFPYLRELHSLMAVVTE
jgi:hypothetical protein